MSRIRIVVADQAEAIFYDAASLQARPTEVARISDPVAHLHEQDLVSDRPGRGHASVSGARYSMDLEGDPRKRGQQDLRTMGDDDTAQRKDDPSRAPESGTP